MKLVLVVEVDEKATSFLERTLGNAKVKFVLEKLEVEVNAGGEEVKVLKVGPECLQ
ncbi:hypothetical protein [Ignicoccus hospitalis]|uniref:hypothetical protein n=1 Tax=Ignicoccus hospitalis TaxID=160233 RepID=UPI000325869B|nr:hypothetical protein [Ignicoccus hospitalis]HIH90838.1 hypothetical protein [Desulfurococcaceae archaeon]